MPDWIVPLADVRFTDEEVDAVAAVYRSGWLSQGPRVAEFEAAFAEYLGVPHAVATASGTTALHLGLAAAGVAPGDEVIVPSLTFAATAATVVQCGAVPVFADVAGVHEPWLSCGAVRAAIGPRTRAVVTVAYAGHPGEAAALRDLCEARGLLLVEDAAHALGARAHDRAVGAIGHVGAFSFFANKNLHLGEGGMLVCADEATAGRARRLRSHGLSSDTWTRHRGGELGYDVVEPGFNYRLDEPRAALGQLLLARLDGDNAHRRRLVSDYGDALRAVDGVTPVLPADRDGEVTGAWHIYPVLLQAGVDRASFRRRLADLGVQTSVHYRPLHLTRAFHGADRAPLTVTEDYGHRTVTLPLFAHMSGSQQSRVVEAVASALR